MYLARKHKEKKVNYYIRESFSDGESIKSREICDLGSNPKQFVIYPDGSTSFYFDPQLIEKIESSGIKPDTEELEKIFWPFLEPETRSVIERFSRPASRQETIAQGSEKALRDRNVSYV
jgi:hypothetical protein